jgi:hypothetical protein
MRQMGPDPDTLGLIPSESDQRAAHPVGARIGEHILQLRVHELRQASTPGRATGAG